MDSDTANQLTHDITQIEVRKNIIDEIESSENKYRKEESFRRFEIYRERQEKYILQRLAGSTSISTAREMRTMTSINLTRKMIHEMASIYRYEPTREFTLLSDQQKETMLSHYRYSNVNVNMKKSNRMYKLHEQCAVKIIPKNGLLSFDVLQPHHYDVVPSKFNPEKAEVYVISSFDRSRVQYSNNITTKERRFENRSNWNDGVNQKIGDADDWNNEKNKVYYWWNAGYNFKTNRAGQVLDNNGQPLASVDFNQYVNPIGELPFCDIATEKDYEFWVRAGSGVTEFNIDLGSQLSDNVNINSVQGFSQAVISSVEEPKDILIGPKRVLWLKKDPKGESQHQPEFTFATPSADIKGSIELSESLLKYFLVSKSINIKNMLDGTSNASSGFERLLMMIERFEASQDDIDVFKSVESRAYEIMVKWHNVYRSTTNGLSKKVDGPVINEDSEMMIKFGGPQAITSKTDKINNLILEMDNGFITPVEAIMQLREVDEEMALDIYNKVKQFNQENLRDLITKDAKDLKDDELSSDEEE